MNENNSRIINEEKLKNAKEFDRNRDISLCYSVDNGRLVRKHNLNTTYLDYLLYAEDDECIVLIDKNLTQYDDVYGYSNEIYEMETFFKSKEAVRKHLIDVWDSRINECIKEKELVLKRLDRLSGSATLS